MCGDPPLVGLSLGDPVDLVLRALTSNTAIACWHEEPCVLHGGTLEADSVWTLYGARYLEFRDGFHQLEVSTDTLCFKRPIWDLRAFATMKEVCAGIGGISMGLEAAGGQATVFLDRMPLACQTLRRNNCFVIEGDLKDRETRIQLHAADPQRAALLGAGVPCQGFSRQGDGLGFGDARSRTISHVLQCAWHLQSCGVVLECVSEIQLHLNVIGYLQTFARKAGYQLHQLVIDLADQWMSRRLRWWAVMLPASMPLLELAPWPAMRPSPVVGDILAQWPVWPVEDEQALKWTPEEVEAFRDPSLGTEPRVLDMAAKCPTALHSWGSALSRCPCGCRESPLSRTRLRNFGLRGLGVPAALTGDMRHFHQEELGFLNAVPLSFEYLPDVRASLCLLV